MPKEKFIRKNNLFHSFIFSILISLPSVLFAQLLSTPPVQNGVITGAEYGSNSNTGPWYIGWDNTNLYVALKATQAHEPAIMYFDLNPTTSTLGGVATGTNGSTNGKDDWGTTPQLPFVAKARLYFATSTGGGNYAEVSLNKGSGWETPVAISSQFNTSAPALSKNFELYVNWAQLGGGGTMPSAFNWLATESSVEGYIYNPFPTINYFGNTTSTPVYHYYQSVTNTNTFGTDALSNSCKSFTNYSDNGFNYINSLPTTLYDFTLGKTINTDSCKVVVKTPITITHNLVVNAHQ